MLYIVSVTDFMKKLKFRVYNRLLRNNQLRRLLRGRSLSESVENTYFLFTLNNYVFIRARRAS